VTRASYRVLVILWLAVMVTGVMLVVMSRGGHMAPPTHLPLPTIKYIPHTILE